MKKLTKTLSGCKNDNLIIMRMKSRGVWARMQKGSAVNKSMFIFLGHDLFIWHGAIGDSGYTHFRSKNHAELLGVASRILDQTKQSETLH